MKKKMLIGVVILFLFLDFLALDDTTTGNEPNFTGEYLTLILSGLVFAVSAFFLFKKK